MNDLGFTIFLVRGKSTKILKDADSENKGVDITVKK
ncbi:Uncharacterised protein [Streptococcus pneumoniae]|nr:Uncharacterised protein [Streptococcus pneumoniae]